MRLAIKLFIITATCLNINSSLLAQQNPKVDAAKTSQRLEDKVKQYWFVMLTAGKNRTQDSLVAAKIQEAHMANINKLYNEGKLKVAGPFGDDGDWRGIFIFDCDTKEEVMNLLNTDPAIASGRLAYELHPWWTAAMGSFKPGKPLKN